MEVPHEAAVPDNGPPTVQPPAQWATATAATRERQPRWLDWPEQPTLRAESRAEFAFAGCHGRLASDGPNFLKGCKWAPDGSCILTASDDNVLRLFNSPAELDQPPPTDPNGAGPAAAQEQASVLQMLEGETIYDYSWYPYMSSYTPASCCFASSSRDHPVHLWDAFTGQLRCTYSAYDHLDEVAPAYTVAFSADGTELLTGFKDMVRIFNVDRPGRWCQKRSTTTGRGKKQKGIISCIAVPPGDNSFYACGSYSKTVGLYDNSTGEAWAVMKAPSGVTQLMFNADSTMLFASCRQHSSIQCWDLRNPRTPVAAFKRETHTNQRMMFDLDSEGQFLVTGDQTGDVCIFDLKSDEAVASTPQEPMPPSKAFRACGDSVNGVSLHPSLAVLATGSGKRNFTSSMAIDSSDEDSNDEESADEKSDCSLKFWSVGPP